jgi:hypothetical protein
MLEDQSYWVAQKATGYGGLDDYGAEEEKERLDCYENGDDVDGVEEKAPGHSWDGTKLHIEVVSPWYFFLASWFLHVQNILYEATIENHTAFDRYEISARRRDTISFLWDIFVLSRIVHSHGFYFVWI